MFPARYGAGSIGHTGNIRGMILLFTDFGLDGPYVGQMKAVLADRSPMVPVIDLMHDAPVCNPLASAYLLAALAPEFPRGSIFLSVVDPGVGTDRKPILLEADGRWFVGPDNGLFALIVRRARSARAWEITWRPENLSNSFHGRDLFAPIAGELAADMVSRAEEGKSEAGQGFLTSMAGSELSSEFLDRQDWPDQLAEIVYIDRFGNGISGVNQENLSPNDTILVHNVEIKGEKTFGSVSEGTMFWYGNSNGLVEIACNRGRAERQLKLTIGTAFKVVSGRK